MLNFQTSPADLYLPPSRPDLKQKKTDMFLMRETSAAWAAISRLICFLKLGDGKKGFGARKQAISGLSWSV